MIVTCVAVYVKEEHIDDFIEVTTKNHEGSVKEPGNVRFDVLQRRDDPTTFLLYEAYESEEDVAAHKPDPAGLLSAAAELGAPRARTLYVGDSVTDAETAQRARIPFAAVLSGVTPAQAFTPYRPRAILPSVMEVPGWMQENRA